MWSDLKAAARAGVLMGVKVATAALIVLFALAWFLGDYQTVRQRAVNGQIAYERLERMVSALKQSAAAPPPSAPQESTHGKEK